MKRTCGIQLALYIVIATVIGAIVYGRAPHAQPAVMTAMIGGFVVWLGLAYLIGAPGKLSDARLIHRAMLGERPEDGRKAAVIGRINPSRSALKSPFGQTSAVAYKYEVHTRGLDDWTTSYSGFALNPAAIQTPHGPVRLLAFPELVTRPVEIAEIQARSNASAYINTTTFREAGGLRKAIDDLVALYTDDDGTIRHDQRMGVGPAADLSSAKLLEWVITPGQKVCAIGLYSATRGALVHDPKNPLQQVRILTDEPEVLAGRSRRAAIGYFIAGLIILGGAVGALTALVRGLH